MNNDTRELTLNDMDVVIGGDGKLMGCSGGVGATVSKIDVGAASLVSAVELGQMVVNCVKILTTPSP